MATDVRRRLPDLILKIARDTPGYDVFQLVRILEWVWGAYDEPKGRLDKRVRLRAAKEISFPPADIRRVVRGADGRFNVELNFMGLYGVDAAVPHYFVQTAMRNDEAGETTRAFLDIFNHRFYVLLYQAWRKYHPAVDLENKTSRYWRYLGALGGHDGEHGAAGSLPFTGLYGAKTRSGIALRGMLQELAQTTVAIEQFVPRWVKINSKGRLGGSGEREMALGHNAVLGNEVLDVGGKVKVRIGPVPFERAAQLLPGEPEGSVMGELTAEYLGPGIEFDTTLVVEGAHGTAPPLGADGLRLGWRTWLGEASGKPYPIHISGGEFRRARAAVNEPEHRATERAAA